MRALKSATIGSNGSESRPIYSFVICSSGRANIALNLIFCRKIISKMYHTFINELTKNAIARRKLYS